MLNADSGVQGYEFEGRKGSYRKLTIFEKGSPEMVHVNVPVDYKLPCKIGDEIQLNVYTTNTVKVIL